MGLSDKLAGVVDGYYKVFDPQKFNQRKAQRAIDSLTYRNSRQSRIVRGNKTTRGSGDSHVTEPDLDTLREKSRELDRDNIFAKAILDRLLEAILGTGISINIQSPNKGWNKKAERLFMDWWHSMPDARGMFSGPEFEKMVYRTLKVDGDVLVVMTKSGKLQIVEGDRIRTPKKFDKDDSVVHGVKMDKLGKPEAFYVFPHADKKRDKATNFETIDAKDAIFLGERHRYSLTRGIPCFTQSMELFDDIDAFTEASIIQQKISASHVMFIERNGGLDALDGISSAEDEYGNARQEQVMSPGTILYGDKGESAKMLGASQTGQQFGPFVTQLLRFAGIDFGLPLEILLLDFSKTNYSSARASLLTAHKHFIEQHKRFVAQFMAPVVKRKISEFMKKGLLARRDEDAYMVGSVPPKMLSLDPSKETKADVERIKAGLTSNREVCNSSGTDWQDTLGYRQDEILEAIRIADNVVKRTGVDVSFRDILGMNSDFKSEIFNEEEPNERSQDDTE